MGETVQDRTIGLYLPIVKNVGSLYAGGRRSLLISTLGQCRCTWHVIDAIKASLALQTFPIALRQAA